MKYWLYRKFKDFFLDEIHHDHGIKLWIEATARVHMVEQEAYKRGYETGNIETKDQYEGLVDKKVKDKFSEVNFLVNPNHVFQQLGGIPYLGLEPITKQEATNLRSEAITLKSMKVWEVFQNMIRSTALDLGFKKSSDWKQTESYKNMVYNLDILKTTVDTIANINLDKIPERTGDVGR